jgi:DNA-binding NarL/FixJ family response regulator
MNVDVPLKVLVCDPNSVTREALVEQLSKHEAVMTVHSSENITIAESRLREDDINTIFIDPLVPNFDAAANFILSVRKSFPEIVFVLYMDVATAEANRQSFYLGERQRFSHSRTKLTLSFVPVRRT